MTCDCDENHDRGGPQCENADQTQASSADRSPRVDEERNQDWRFDESGECKKDAGDSLSLVSEPTGRSLGVDQSMLPPWHTWNYLVYGLFSLTVLGMAPLICVAAVIVDVRGTTAASGVLGILTLAWVLYRILVLDVDAPYAHATLTAIGALLIAGAASTALHRHRHRH